MSGTNKNKTIEKYMFYINIIVYVQFDAYILSFYNDLKTIIGQCDKCYTNNALGLISIEIINWFNDWHWILISLLIYISCSVFDKRFVL